MSKPDNSEACRRHWYSASVDDFEMLFCFLHFQEIKEFL